jgi:hypothetical protein
MSIATTESINKAIEIHDSNQIRDGYQVVIRVYDEARNRDRNVMCPSRSC